MVEEEAKLLAPLEQVRSNFTDAMMSVTFLNLKKKFQAF